MVGIIECQRNYIYKEHWLIREELKRCRGMIGTEGMNGVTVHKGDDG
jgi:hypothetical protein